MEIIQSNSTQVDFIDKMLTKYNQEMKPMTQSPSVTTYSYSAIEEGSVVGGISGYASYYQIGYIDTLWVDDKFRRCGIGATLLTKLEKDLQNFGCAVIYLETFDFQGPEFYRANGYKEFGKLYYPNVDLHEYFFAKNV